MVTRQRQRHAGFLRDVAQRHGVERAFAEQRLGGVENALARRIAIGAAGGAGRFGFWKGGHDILLGVATGDAKDALRDLVSRLNKEVEKGEGMESRIH